MDDHATLLTHNSPVFFDPAIFGKPVRSSQAQRQLRDARGRFITRP